MKTELVNQTKSIIHLQLDNDLGDFVNENYIGITNRFQNWIRRQDDFKEWSAKND